MVKRIYISVTDAVESKYAFIYKLSAQDDRIYQIGSNSVGCLYEANDLLYFINTWEKTATQAFNGENHLYQIDNDTLIEKFELPYGIMAKDMFFMDDFIFILDGRNDSVDKFNFNGAYVETVYQYPL